MLSPAVRVLALAPIAGACSPRRESSRERPGRRFGEAKSVQPLRANTSCCATGAQVLVCGMRGLAAEICKNIVLAGALSPLSANANDSCLLPRYTHLRARTRMNRRASCTSTLRVHRHVLQPHACPVRSDSNPRPHVNARLLPRRRGQRFNHG